MSCRLRNRSSFGLCASGGIRDKPGVAKELDEEDEDDDDRPSTRLPPPENGVWPSCRARRLAIRSSWARLRNSRCFSTTFSPESFFFLLSLFESRAGRLVPMFEADDEELDDDDDDDDDDDELLLAHPGGSRMST